MPHSFQKFYGGKIQSNCYKEIVDEELKVIEDKIKNFGRKDGEIANIALSFDE